MENRPVNNGRLRPEAQEFAMKNTEENNWFSHDSKDPAPAAPVPNRSGSKAAKALASKYKVESEDWYHYTHKGVPNGVAVPKPKVSKTLTRCGTPDARKNLAKIKGTEESWYKHEDNMDFVSPRPKSRLTYNAQESKQKNTGSPSEWYKHEHGSSNGYAPPRAKSRLASPSAQAIKSRMRPQGTPVWASYDKNGADSTDGDSRPHSRLTGNEALSLQKKSKGSAEEWFGHHANGNVEIMSPRRGSEEGQHNAQKLKDGAGNWFNHDANKNYIDPVKAPRCRSAAGREMIEKTRGAEVDKVMHHENISNQNGHVNSHVKPEAAEFAKKSVQGMMSKYLDQDANKDYQSARPGPRVKPEAQDNAEKNKGVMNDCLDGYPDTPKKHDVRRIKPEGEDYANRNRGVAGRAITGDLPGSARKHPRIKGEAEKYADRNKGTLDLLGNFAELEVTGTPVKHRSKEAEVNAARWRGGEMNNIFNMN